jgi:hypothetical protein
LFCLRRVKPVPVSATHLARRAAARYGRLEKLELSVFLSV